MNLMIDDAQIEMELTNEETIINQLLEMIPTGREDAISRADLARQLNLSDRDTRNLIHKARQSSYPILSNTSKGGYYWPGTNEEADAFIRQQNSYIANINITIAPVKRWRESKGQRRIKF